MKARIQGLARGFPLTWGGMLLVGASAVAVGVYGFGRRDLLLLVLGALGGIVAVLALLGVVAGAVRIAVALRKTEEAAWVEAECGRPAVTGLRVPALGWIPWVGVSWRWITPEMAVRPVRRGGWLHERVIPTRRAEVARIVREFEVADAFGIARIRFRRTVEHRVRVLPHTGALDQVHVVHGLAGGDAMGHPEGAPVGDRLDMRHYAPGDPIRLVLWKVFARSRALVVRTPERAISPIQQTVAYLVAGEGDEAAAGTARVVVRHGSLGGDWVLGADGVPGEATSVPEAIEAIVKSSRTSPEESGAGLHRFLARAPGGTRRAVVFVPPRPGPWLERVVGAASAVPGGPGRLDFVVCMDGIAPARRRGVAERLLFVDPPGAPDTRARRDEVAAVVAALGRTGSRVLVVDRTGGQVLPADHLRVLGAA